MVSDPSAQFLLVLAGVFTHRMFSSAQDDDTRGWMVSQAGGIAACLEDGIPVSQPSPLGEGAPQGRIG